jgi:DNA-binding LytR/AlgR family response regulator
MRIPVRKVKKIIIWVLIGVIVSVLYFVGKETISDSPRLYLYIFTLIPTVIVILFCIVAGYPVLYHFKSSSSLIHMTLTLTATMCAGGIAELINYNLNKYLFGIYSVEYKIQYAFITQTIVAIITIITVCIERMKFVKDRLETDLNAIKLATVTRVINDSLSIRENEFYHVIKYDDLKYISSHGKKTSLHTVNRDYETNQLIKNFEYRLPENFVRIHKQFIVNKKYLSKIKYHKGGRYIAYLLDDDDVLPVSKNIVHFLKGKPGI